MYQWKRSVRWMGIAVAPLILALGLISCTGTGKNAAGPSAKASAAPAPKIQPESLKRGPYLQKGIPLDPWGNDYVYEYPGRYNIDGYDLMSMGPDRKIGGDDDIVNWNIDNY